MIECDVHANDTESSDVDVIETSCKSRPSGGDRLHALGAPLKNEQSRKGMKPSIRKNIRSSPAASPN